VTHFVDEFPLDWSYAGLQELWRILSRAYPIPDKILVLVKDVRLPEEELFFGRPAAAVWRDVLDLARRRDKLRPLLVHVQEDLPPIARRLGELLADEPLTEAPGPAGGATANEWPGFDPTGGEEAQIVSGFKTLLGIAFLEQGLAKARSVGRFYTVLAGERHHGTGFRIGADLLLTNHHVLHHWQRGDARATHVEVWFNYELDWDKRYCEHRVVSCAPDSIIGEKGHDWAVVRATAPIPVEFPALELTAPRTVPGVNDRVYIIQHPNGEPKMIGMDHNLVRHVDENIVQYWTDTERGSSGAPVFDDDWQVVALHHKTVKIPREGKPDEYRNQGRRIEKIIDRMAMLGVG